MKRTLTNEQISIFRHSEIHSLLQKEALLETSTPELSEASNLQDLGHDPVKFKDISKSSEEELVCADNDDEEYAIFLEKEKREFETAATQRRMQKRDDSKPTDRTISTRRRVRELDTPTSTNDTLDYGDF